MQDVRVIAAPREENDVLREDRARLARWAPDHEWRYFEYENVLDLLSRVNEAVADGSILAELEIVAHGNPAICNDISVGNVDVVAETLGRIAGVNSWTAVYLSGCNTGLEFNGDCIAQSFASALDGPVFGARGYLRGTHAEQDEECVASFELDGIVYHAYPGGTDAIGNQVWRRFGRSPGSDDGEHMQIKIATSGFRAVNLSAGEGENVRVAVERALQRPAAQSPRLRMAPDLTFAIRLEDGEHVFELLAGGTVLRDPISKRVWQFEEGRAILLNLMHYRKLPAA